MRKQPGKLPLSQRLALVPLSPRPLGVGDQLVHQIARPNNVQIAERLPTVGKKLDIDRVVMTFAR
jgi:hypothetical protein